MYRFLLPRAFSRARQRESNHGDPDCRRGVEKEAVASFIVGQLNRRRLQIGVGPLPCDFIRSAIPSGVANCAGNDGPYRTASKGTRGSATYICARCLHTRLAHVRRARVKHTGSSIRRLSQNVILITLTSFHGCRAFTPPCRRCVSDPRGFRLIKHRTDKKSV